MITSYQEGKAHENVICINCDEIGHVDCNGHVRREIHIGFEDEMDILSDDEEEKIGVIEDFETLKK